MMPNPHERSRVQTLLEERYGADLVPSEAELAFPGDPAVGDLESWQPAFDNLKALYGKEVGTSRRLGKDLQNHKQNDGLLWDALQFSRLDEYKFRGGN